MSFSFPDDICYKCSCSFFANRNNLVTPYNSKHPDTAAAAAEAFFHPEFGVSFHSAISKAPSIYIYLYFTSSQVYRYICICTCLFDMPASQIQNIYHSFYIAKCHTQTLTFVEYIEFINMNRVIHICNIKYIRAYIWFSHFDLNMLNLSKFELDKCARPSARESACVYKRFLITITRSRKKTHNSIDSFFQYDSAM